jgi:outer membrane protein TolC
MMLLLATAALAAPMVLTYEEALVRAGRASAEVRDAGEALRAAEGAVLAARAAFEPRFTLGGSGFSSTSEGQFQFGEYHADTFGYALDVGLSQPLATGTALGVDLGMDFVDTAYDIDFLDDEVGDPAWQSRLAFTLSQELLQGVSLSHNLMGVRSARRAKSVAEADLQARRQQALAEAAGAYWELHLQRRLASIAGQGLAAAKSRADVGMRLAEAGRLAPVDAARLDQAVLEAERSSRVALAAAEAAEDALLVAMGETPGIELELATNPADPVPTRLDGDQVVEGVLQGNPGLVALRIRADAARQEAADRRHALLPQLSARASYGLNGYEPTLSGALDEVGAGELPEFSVGAQLSVPIFNLSDRGALAEAGASAAQAEVALHRAEASAVQAARAQVRVVEDAEQAVRMARAGADLAQRVLAAEEARLAEGRAIQRDVIDAQRDLDAARGEVERALVEYQRGVVELLRLRGSL